MMFFTRFASFGEEDGRGNSQAIGATQFNTITLLDGPR